MVITSSWSCQESGSNLIISNFSNIGYIVSVVPILYMEWRDTIKQTLQSYISTCAVLIITVRQLIFSSDIQVQSNPVCPPPGPTCSPAGSFSALPDGMSGRCLCRPGYYGDICQYSAVIGQPGSGAGQCRENQFLSREEAVGGCINW